LPKKDSNSDVVAGGKVVKKNAVILIPD